MDNKIQVVCFGEVLWDILPSGSVPGGAPMNVAYHLHRQKKNAALITKIGDDAEGKALLELFQAKGISTEFFQVDERYETGKVYASRNDKGDMTYDIVKPSAWDFIEWRESHGPLISEAAYMVYGSLAARDRQSKETLYKLLEKARQKVFDINLRAPHYDKDTLLELLQKANLLKMNEDELEFVSPWFSSHTNLEDKMKAISDKLNLSLFVVTKGERGATLFVNETFYSHPGIRVQVADTVGSGDAFLAALLSNLIDKQMPEKILENAIKTGAFVATQRGGMPDYEIRQIEGM